MSSGKKNSSYTVGPVLLGFFLFVVVGSGKKRAPTQSWHTQHPSPSGSIVGVHQAKTTPCPSSLSTNTVVSVPFLFFPTAVIGIINSATQAPLVPPSGGGGQ